MKWSFHTERSNTTAVENAVVKKEGVSGRHLVISRQTAKTSDKSTVLCLLSIFRAANVLRRLLQSYFPVCHKLKLDSSIEAKCYSDVFKSLHESLSRWIVYYLTLQSTLTKRRVRYNSPIPRGGGERLFTCRYRAQNKIWTLNNLVL